MAHTVIGFFDNRINAERAVAQLVNEGLNRDRIDLVASRNENDDAAATLPQADGSREPESAIVRFFKNLFGNDNDEASRFSRVAGTTDCMVTVHARSANEAERAADLLDDNGALDVDEQETRLGSVADDNRVGNTAANDLLSGQDVAGQANNEAFRSGQTAKQGLVRVRSRIIEWQENAAVRFGQSSAHNEPSAISGSEREGGAAPATYRGQTNEEERSADEDPLSGSDLRYPFGREASDDLRENLRDNSYPHP